MNPFYYYILISLLLTMIVMTIISYLLKDKLLPMHRMIVSMTVSMNIGLTGGVLFGVLFQGELYFSTIISIFFGLLAGALSGISLGILSAIEGAMAGLMGSMMGAMLGDMISGSEASIILMIFITFTISSLLLFFVLCAGDSQTRIGYNRKWLFKPLFVFMGIGSYLLFGFQLSKDVSYSNQQDHNPGHLAEIFHQSNNIGIVTTREMAMVEISNTKMVT
ncbi:hypothetical protein [Alkalihalobacterium alkalinitrilicum]|uniref:hypothetical protein n=1 Tax=Alkalihalobacterium alkalinitrilicum TaxID=427920 RepID=UPI000994ABAA|nr:hypothetical protein [Alkalihalobacterium alkalinitrilicum]